MNMQDSTSQAGGAYGASRVAAAILAGGRSSRMGGRNKAFVDVNGAPMIVEATALLKGLFDEVMIVTNTPHEYEALASDAVIFTDIITGCGPLGGIHAALSHTKHEAVFFTGCDMPHLHAGLIQHMTDRFATVREDALVPRLRGMAEPLHAIYRTCVKDRIHAFVEQGASFSVNRFLETISVCYWDMDGLDEYHEAFANLNTEEEVEQARQRQHGRVVERWLDRIRQ